MAKSHNQKAKILFLAQMLRESGENRVLSMQDILAELMEYGIQAERKSIYDDIEALRDFGMDVKFKRGRPGGYYLAGQSAMEIKEKQSTETEKDGCQTCKKKSEAMQAKESKTEEASPSLEVVPEQEPGAEWKFTRGNSVGDKRMKLLCSMDVKAEVQEYFGSSAEYKEKGLSYFTVTSGLLSDAQFFGWLTAMGKDVHIVKPKKTAQAYRDYLKSLAKEYKGI